MALLITSLALLAFSFLAQLLWWRLRRPRRQLRALLVVYAVAPLLFVTLCKIGGYPIAVAPPETVRIALFYVSFSLAYFVAHCAIDSGSPTLDIISYVAEAGPDGRSEAQLAAKFGPDSAMTGRFSLVEHGGLMRAEGDRFHLTRSGRVFAGIFDEASRIFGLPRGG